MDFSCLLDHTTFNVLFNICKNERFKYKITLFFYFFILVLKVKADVTIVSFYLKDIQKTTLST